MSLQKTCQVVCGTLKMNRSHTQNKHLKSRQQQKITGGFLLFSGAAVVSIASGQERAMGGLWSFHLVIELQWNSVLGMALNKHLIMLYHNFETWCFRQHHKNIGIYMSMQVIFSITEPRHCLVCVIMSLCSTHKSENVMLCGF